MILSRHRKHCSKLLQGPLAGALALSLIGAVGSTAQVPCDTGAETLRAAPAPQRLATAMALIESECQPLAPEIVGAIRTRRWADRAPLVPNDRIALLNAAVAHGYEEAIELSVQVLETGAWPGAEGTAAGGQADEAAEPLDATAGAQVIEGLVPALDSYRILLLLDVYEQVSIPTVRLSVVRALKAVEGSEALLPALDAYWSGQEEIKALASDVIASQPEKTADAVLVRVAKELPTGPVLEWARRLAKANGVEAAVEAAKRD